MLERAMFSIEVDTHEVDRVLGLLMQRSQNLRPLLLEIGEDLIDSTKNRFETSTAPDGSTWDKNSDVTLARKSSNKPLIDTNTLYESINYQKIEFIGDDAVAIGADKEYAAMMQFGGTKAEFGHLWGDIPARPYLGFSEADKENILDLVVDYLL